MKNLLNNDMSLTDVFKATPSLICNLLPFIFNKRGLLGPTFLWWTLTYECSIKCKHCYIKQKFETLSKDQKLKIARNIACSSVYWVSFVGGEPLIVSEIVDIVRILKKSNKKVTITTNGLFLNNFVQDIIDVGLDAVHISVDSHRKEVHDYLRNTPGLFDEILKAITEIKRRRKSGRPLIKLRCTLSRENYLEAVDYVKFWKDKVDAIYFQPIVDNIINRVRERSVLFTEQDEVPFRKVLSSLQKDFIYFRNMYYSRMPDFVFHRERIWIELGFKCMLVPAAVLNILPDGNTCLCNGRRDESGGNALNQSIREIWRSDSIKFLQDEIKKTYSEGFDYECFCWESCTFFNLYLVNFYNFISKITSKRWLR